MSGGGGFGALQEQSRKVDSHKQANLRHLSRQRHLNHYLLFCKNFRSAFSRKEKRGEKNTFLPLRSSSSPLLYFYCYYCFYRCCFTASGGFWQISLAALPSWDSRYPSDSRRRLEPLVKTAPRNNREKRRRRRRRRRLLPGEALHPVSRHPGAALNRLNCRCLAQPIVLISV